MSLLKAIEHGKERRGPYYDSRRFDSSCRHRGGCPYCEGNRTFRNRRLLARAAEMIRDANGSEQ